MDLIIRGIRVIKLYVWEKPFIRYVRKIRKKEMWYASLAGVTQSTTILFYNNCLFISMFIIYSVAIATANPLTSSQLALAFLIFSNLRRCSVILFGHGLLSGREAIIALKRIQKILELSEDTNYLLTQNTPTPMEQASIELMHFSASWKAEVSNSNNLVLKQINYKVTGARLVAILGPLGSGKSSLLMSLIDELPGCLGEIQIIGTTSYAAQEPWIFSGTFRDNILFGTTLHSQRYQQVIRACSLREDLGSFSEGDLTLIGERGVTLSGGQKARVALARAVYQEADIYLLDDPLSAVDVKVGREIFYNCVKGFLSAKIVFMTTHHIQYAKQADEVIVMREGTVMGSGDYQSVVADEFCKNFLFDLDRNTRRSILVPMLQTSEHDMTGNDDNTMGGCNQTKDRVTEPLTQFITEEDYRPNSSSFSTYIQYFCAGGVCMSIMMLIFTVLSNGLHALSYWWIQSTSTCSDSEYQIIGSAINFTNHSRLLISVPCPWYFSTSNFGSLGVVAVCAFLGSICMAVLSSTFYYITLRASRLLHNRMLTRIMYCPMDFFNTNPSGRILNRFSKDIGFLDEQLPFIFYYFWNSASYIVAATIASCSTQYILIIPVLLTLILALSLRHYYLRTSSQVKRLESIARSPLYSHISLSLLGLSTIRSLKNEERVTQDFHYFQDRHTAAWYLYATCSRWFETRLDVMASSVAISGICLSLITYYLLGWNQLVGFSLPLLLTIPLTFQYVVRQSGDVDILMVSTDRILNYSSLSQENASNLSLSQLTSLNSSVTEIHFVNISMKYSEHFHYSLVDVSLRILAGEKIGIIGRTGAGKSSLFNALCRMNEVSEGSILIDGIDISKLNLYEHRKRLSVIPQDPVLFSGTLRYNLDPFGEFTDNEIWQAIKSCHLMKMVQILSNQLLSPVIEDGHNLSVGERQLLCLARAILRKNNIILIDEATANVDIHTDFLVQQAVRTHFRDCTLLTIAHRIETVLDSDRIIVLDKGSVVEFDTPSAMLEKEGSYLYESMIDLNLN